MAKKTLYKKLYVYGPFNISDAVLINILEALAKISAKSSLASYHIGDKIEYFFTDIQLNIEALNTNASDDILSFSIKYISHNFTIQKWWISFPKEFNLENFITIYKINPEKAKENICFIYE